MKNFDFIYKIDPNTRLLLTPAMFIFFIGFLLAFSVYTGYSKINDQMNDLDSARTEEQRLNSKLSILREVQEGLLEHSNASLVAVPDKNPTSWSLSLIRKALIDNNLEIVEADARVGTKQNELFQVQIKLNMDGSLKDLLTFAESTKEMAPLIKVKEVELEKGDNNYNGTFKLITFWSVLPTKLPAIDEPITTLNDAELATLFDVKDLVRPEFNILEADPPGDRLNPFDAQ